jgi:hypothetical protein
LEDYLKAIDSLTINDQNKLQKQVAVLSEKNREENIETKTKLHERDNDIAELKAAVAFLTNKVNAAVIGDPSGKVILNEKGVATAIEFTAVNNRATAEIAKAS